MAQFKPNILANAFLLPPVYSSHQKVNMKFTQVFAFAGLASICLADGW
jgi:hypothetical protein